MISNQKDKSDVLKAIHHHHSNCQMKSNKKDKRDEQKIIESQAHQQPTSCQIKSDKNEDTQKQHQQHINCQMNSNIKDKSDLLKTIKETQIQHKHPNCQMKSNKKTKCDEQKTMETQEMHQHTNCQIKSNKKENSDVQKIIKKDQTQLANCQVSKNKKNVDKNLKIVNNPPKQTQENNYQMKSNKNQACDEQKIVLKSSSLNFFKVNYEDMVKNKHSNILFEDIVSTIPFLEENSYYLQKIIGFGNFGMVFLGKNANGILCAIKLITYKNSQDLAQFLEESSLMRSLKSPYVSKFSESFIDPQNKSHFYIITQYYEGGDLENYLKKNQNLTENQIVKLFQGILLGINALHSKQIIHSDLKPENILLTKNNQPIISDFGMANMIKKNKIDATKKGFNLEYAPFELLQDESRISYSTDYFSLGMILFVLCGQKDKSEIYHMKGGIFPDFNYKPFKNLLLLAKEMMAFEPSQRMSVEKSLLELKKMYPLIV